MLGALRLSKTDGGWPVHIVSLVPLPSDAARRIAEIAPAATVRQVAGWFDDELRQAWGDHTADLYLGPRSPGTGTRAERDAILAEADVIVGGFPVPVDLVARAPRLRWFHQTPAGASNLRRCDLWGSDVVVTTSRGLGNTLAIAEYVVGSFLHFARGLHHAADQRTEGRFDRRAYRPVLLAGKTACIVGVGGIGQEVGRLCAALGMQVVGTRRSVGSQLPAGFAEVTPPSELLELLAGSTFVAICCQLTPETHELIGRDALAAMPDGAVLVNVARGEIVDEAGLVGHLDRLGGVALDVYVGEFDRRPPDQLWSHPRVLVTPHVSAGADSRSQRPLQLFCENLSALLAGRPLANVVDWQRGY